MNPRPCHSFTVLINFLFCLQLVEGSRGEDRQRESPSCLFCGHISLQGIVRKKGFCFVWKTLLVTASLKLSYRYILVIVEKLFVKNVFFHIAKNFFLEDYVIASVVRQFKKTEDHRCTVGDSWFPLYQVPYCKLLIRSEHTNRKQQCCGSGSGFWLDLDTGGQKLLKQRGEKLIIYFIFWSAVFSLLRVEGFSCTLNVF
jgi:hypothetical protein